MSILDLFFGQPPELKAALAWSDQEIQPQPAPVVNAISLDEMPPARFRWHNGESFPGGYGETQLVAPDYWTLRARSVELFTTNLFARGIIRRIVTNTIAAGLYLEATPDESLLGLEEEALADWAEDVENRFRIWGNDAQICDHQGQNNFGALQAAGFREALISGDVLATLRQSKRGTPQLRLFRGDAVQTPALSMGEAKGKRIEHGVELDDDDRHVAYWVTQRDGTQRRLPAWGSSGRRLAWLAYATDRRFGDVRGQPILSLILEGLKELRRYQAATTRKAQLNANLALWVEKTEDKPGSRSLAAGAVRADTVRAVGADGTDREWNGSEYIPGMILHELQHGEKVHAHSNNGTDEKYGDFEEALVQGFAWALEIPPEVLRLSFSSNYSASKAAENNLSVYLFTVRNSWGAQFCSPIYVDWLLSETLRSRIQAPGLLKAWRSRLADYIDFGAWTLAEWSGNIKPSVDPVKQVEGYKRAMAEGLMTRDRACREHSGMKFTRVARQLKRENEALAEANKPMAPPAPEIVAPPGGDEGDLDDEQKKQDEEDAA